MGTFRILFFALSTLLVSWSAAAQIYPTLAGDMQRTSRSPYVGPEDGDAAATVDVSAAQEIRTPAAVAFDGTVYLGTDTGLAALHRDGTPSFHYATAGPVDGAPTIAFDGTVYFGDRSGRLYALHADGTLKWSFQAGGGIASSPALAAHGAILVTDLAGNLYRLRDEDAPVLLCEYQHTGPIYSSPAVGGDGLVYFGARSPGDSPASLYAVDSSCSLVSRVKTSGRQVMSAPVIDSAGNVYVVSKDDVTNAGSLEKFQAGPILSPNAAPYSLPWTGRGSVALSPDEATLYLTSDETLLAISASTLGLLWSDSVTRGNESTPVVDADGTVYWASEGQIRAYDSAGTLLWSRSTGNEIFGASSPVLGALGYLYVGGRVTSGAALDIVRNERPWPSSDVRLDLAASSGLSYSDGYFQSMSGMAMVTNMSTLLHKRVELDPNPSYEYRIVEFDRRWGKTADTYISIDEDRAAYLNSFNPDFFTYDTIVDSPEHYTRFLHYWNSENPHQPLGSYLSSVTCVGSPQDLGNLSMAGNSYPATVLDCCAITGETTDCAAPLGTPPFYNAADGRYFLRLEDSAVVGAAMTHLRSILKKQHLTPHLFLDNGRYPIANSGQAEDCHDCVEACPDSDEACIESCKQGPACTDDRDSSPVHIGSGYYVPMDKLMGYYSTLLGTLNEESYKGILNTAVVPCFLGDSIEEDWLDAFEAAVGPGNGLAFEQGWHASCKANPRFVEQEIRVYQRFLGKGMLVLHYPKYADVGEQMWTAAMDVSVREPGQSLFLSRSGGVAAPFWVDWSAFYGAPAGPIAFHTPCTDCMTEYRSVGDWYTTRGFAGGKKITTVGLYQDVELDAYKKEGDSLSYSDESSLNRESLKALLPGYDLTQYTVVHEPRLGTAFDVALGEYQIDNPKLIDEFNAVYKTVKFGTVCYANNRIEDYFGLGKGCDAAGTHCDELVMVSMQIMLKINKDDPVACP